MFKLISLTVLYPSILTLISIVALACSSGDSQDTPLEDTALLEAVEAKIELTGAEFSNGGDIPAVYTCYGLDVSPPVS